jgi:hypothetical protein
MQEPVTEDFLTFMVFLRQMLKTMNGIRIKQEIINYISGTFLAVDLRMLVLWDMVIPSIAPQCSQMTNLSLITESLPLLGMLSTNK